MNIKRLLFGFMSRYICLVSAFVLVGVMALSAVDDEGYDEYTIRPSDIPKDAPRFEDYPAKSYRGGHVALDLRSHPDAMTYRTRLKAWAKEKPNFAGHYILATWGCGASCTHITIINVRTGKVFFPDGARTNLAVDTHHALLGNRDVFEVWSGAGTLRYQTDSRLLVLIGMPEENEENRGISYFVWENERLRRVRFIPKVGYSAEK